MLLVVVEDLEEHVVQRRVLLGEPGRFDAAVVEPDEDVGQVGDRAAGGDDELGVGLADLVLGAERVPRRGKVASSLNSSSTSPVGTRP